MKLLLTLGFLMTSSLNNVQVFLIKCLQQHYSNKLKSFLTYVKLVASCSQTAKSLLKIFC